MSDELRFYSVDALHNFSLAELQSLWELVPTDRQRAYRAAYDREVRTAGAGGSDALEIQLAEQLLDRYTETALVPAGMRWVKAPARVREAAMNDTVLASPESAAIKEAKSPKLGWIIGLIALVFVGVMLTRLSGGGESVAPESTAEASTTPTPEVSPTPTPLALEAQDDVIQSGDRERAVAYPVNLQVTLPDGSPPRVWVVQRREVRAAEWNFDANPDIASFVNGMSVRPVIGIPHSDDNAALFEAVGAGTIFTVTMNTGAILRFEFAEKAEVLRSDTRIFRQVGPGLVLLLIGETDADGLPTGTRTLVTASYPPDQELSRLDDLLSLVPTVSVPTVSVPTPEPPAAGGLAVQVVSVTTQADRLTARLRLYNGSAAPMTFSADDISLTLGYTPNPPGPRLPAEGLTPFTLLPDQAADLTLVWVWDGEPFGVLMVGGHG